MRAAHRAPVKRLAPSVRVCLRFAAGAVFLLAATIAQAVRVPSPAAPLQGGDAVRVLTVGSHERVDLPRDVRRLAVGDENVLAVELLDTRELLVLGRRTGTTTVLVWFTDGERATLRFRVERDLSLLQGAIDDISAGVVVRMAPDRDALVVSGVVPDEAHRQAVLRAATNYLAASTVADVAVAAPAAEGDATDAAAVVIPATAVRGGGPAGQVIDLLRLAELPAALEERIHAAILAVAGPDVRVRRVQRHPLADDAADVLVLEGSVQDQIALVRAMQLAARMFVGDDSTADTGLGSIQVLADEAGALVAGRGNQLGLGGGAGGGAGGGGGFGGGGFGGQGGGFAGGGQVGIRRNEVQRNLGRATVLSMARGRVLSFVEVRDRPQVRVAVQLFELDRDRLFQFASEVQALGSDFRQPPLVPAEVGDRIQPNPANPGAFSDTDVQAGLASLAGGFRQQVQVAGSRFALDALLQALETRGIARRLSNPVLTVLNGETAQFQVGGEVPVPQAFTPAARADAGLGTFASVDFRAFGIGLGIRPLVGRAGEVTLDLSSIVSQPDEALTTVVRDATGTDPQTTAFATRALQTNARLEDGQSLLVGGLVTRSLREDVSKTPLLGDLPLLGWLFRSTNDTYGESELFVLVTPSVVRPAVPGSELWLQPGLDEVLSACRTELRGGRAATAARRDHDGGGAPRGDA